EGEWQVSPVPGEPWCAFALFLDPGRIGVPGHYGHRRGPSARSHGGLTARSLISGLDRTAFALTVYAPPSRSPGPTQDSFLAAGQALPGGIDDPQGSAERFPRHSGHLFPLSQALPDARTTKLSSRAAGLGAMSRNTVMAARSAVAACSASYICNVPIALH